MLPFEDRELLAQAMVGLNVDTHTIETLMASFDDAAAGLESKPLATVSGDSFGASHTGGYRLAANAQMAQEAVVHELKKMAAGLRGMGESVGEFSKDVENIDQVDVVAGKTLTVSTECVVSPTFDGGQCTLPTNSED